MSLSAGEKLPEEVRQKFLKQTGLTIREGLGMTEHSVYLVQRKDRKIIPHACGQAVPGSRIAIVKESRRGDKAPFLVPPGQIGILASHRSCRGLMLGYYNRPEEEKKVFRGDWLLSGDLAYKDKQGNFFYVGRRDDMISAGGFRISPLEIEKVLNQCECVLESAVIGREISPGKTIVQAYVVPQGKPQKEKILDHVRESLAVYKRPREIIFLKELPKTRNGKIKRKDL
ncbi:MAG: AMP-binding protein [Deltaproteobacteria bacterium]|nr:MAG: AMP-binding protein [Deltaproteobacteria bacterium]